MKSGSRTLSDIMAEMFALPGVKANIDALRKAFASSSSDEVRQAVGSAFAVLSIIIDAAGADVKKATGSFFLGLCGNNVDEAFGVIAEQKRRLDSKSNDQPEAS